MANAGIKGGQAGTALRAAVTNLMNPTDKMAKAMKKLGISVTDSKGEMLPFKDVMDDLRKKFSGLTEEQQAQYAATIFGKEAMSGMLAIINASESDYQKLTNATTNYNGAAKEMSEIMQKNLKGSLTNLKSAIEEAGLKIYNVMLPSLTKLVEKAQAGVDWFNNLSESKQKTIVVVGGLVAAIGPLLMMFGTMSGWILKINGLMTLFKGGMAAANIATATMGTATATATGGMTVLGGAAKLGTTLLSPWTAAIVGGGLAAYGLYKHLNEEAIPEVDLFGEVVSESTQKAVTGFLELEEQATMSLNQLSWSGQEVTAEMAESIIGNFDGMKNQIIEKYEEQKGETLRILDELFTDSKTMTAEEKEATVKIVEDKIGEQISETEEGMKKINKILGDASKENREITKEEMKEITKIREDMKENGIKLLSETEKEQLYIMDRLKTESTKISAKQASEIIKNSLEQKKKTIKEAEEEYKERLALAESLRREGGKENEELANKIVEEAKRQRKESIKEAEDMHKNVLKEIDNLGTDVTSSIDTSTGKFNTRWQQMAKDTKKAFQDGKEGVLMIVGEMSEGISKEISSAAKTWGEKASSMKKNISSAFSNIAKDIQKGINKIKKWNNQKAENKKATFTTTIKNIYQTVKEKIIGNAMGTNYFEGGLTWVGEQGRELVNLPRGTQILSNQKSEKAVGGSATPINLTIDVPVKLDGKTIAKGTVRFTAEELQKLSDRAKRGR